MGMFGSRGGLRRDVPTRGVKSADDSFVASSERDASEADNVPVETPQSAARHVDGVGPAPFVDLRRSTPTEAIDKGI